MKKPHHASEPEGLREQLTELSQALLHLHKTLMDSERANYEAKNGKIPSPNHFLQLLLGDPQFSWLRKISKIVAAIDEALDAKDPLTQDCANALLTQTDLLLAASTEGDDYAKKFLEAKERSKAVEHAHTKAAKISAKNPKGDVH